MKNLAKIFALILIVAGFSPALADEVSKSKLADKIMVLFNQNYLDQRQTNFANFLASLKDSDRYCINDEAVSVLTKMDMTRGAKLAEERKKLGHNFFMNNFSEDELKTIDDYQSSAVGKKYNDKVIHVFIPEFYKYEYSAISGHDENSANVAKYMATLRRDNSNGICKAASVNDQSKIKNNNELNPTTNN